MKLSIRINENQLKVLDDVVNEGTLGTSREQVLQTTLIQHVEHLLRGGTPYDSGEPDMLEIRKPNYGAPRFDFVMEPVTGKAVPVYQGEVLRLTQVVGDQCVDFNAYNLHDYKEWLDNGFNRMTSFETGKGTIIWSGCSRARPMYAILEMSETCDQFYAGFRCHALVWERLCGIINHPNCQDTFAETIREYGLTPDDVHDSYNFWMRVEYDSRGNRRLMMNRGQKGDIVDLLALFDTLAVPIICGADINPCNNYEQNPVQVQVFEASPATLKVVNQIQERYGRYHNQRTPTDFLKSEILASRELLPDPSYTPQFLPPSQWLHIDVSVTDEEERLLQSLVRTGHYGPTLEKSLVSSFLKWHTINRQPKFLPRFTVV